MKHHLLLMLLVVPVSATNVGDADQGSTNRVTTVSQGKQSVSLGKRFDRDELVAVVDPALAPLGLTRLSERAQDHALGPPEMSWYGALGYVQGSPSIYYQGEGGLSVLLFADRSLNCIRISVSDWTQPMAQRVIPTINAIATALSKRYGAAMKRYSGLECLHAL